MDPPIARSDRLLRLLVPGLIGLGLCLFVWVLWQLSPSPMTPVAVAVIVLQVYVISELSRSVFRRLERRLGWRRGYGHRLAMQLALGALVAVVYALAIYVPLKLWLISQGERDAVGVAHLASIGLSALGVALFLALAQFALRFFEHWRRSAREAEDRHREALRAELDALRAQVNPHFLFNSLNTVYGLIPEDHDRAQALLLRLAEVFRHALRHVGADRVSLHDELEFVDAYVALLQARHGDALSVSIERRGDERERWLPPLALQTLIENALKHNTLDAGQPLVIQVSREGDQVRVGHELRRRAAPVATSGTGLAAIRRRYALLDAPTLRVFDDGRRFEVTLPLFGAPQ